MRPHRLPVNRDELLAALRIIFVVEQSLGAGSDIRQRIVDLMARAIGQILHRLELLALQPALKVGMRSLLRGKYFDQRRQPPSDRSRRRLVVLADDQQDAATRRPDLLQLEQIASGYVSRKKFLTELTLDPPDATSDQAGVPLLDEDYLILSTIHSAKGQEWKSVYALNVVDGCMPSDLGAGTTAELEEERRLLYVAMTRARDNLHLIVPQRFFVHGQQSRGDRHLYASRTRFIPDHLLQLFERQIWPAAASAVNQQSAGQAPRIDIRERMRGMWR